MRLEQSIIEGLSGFGVVPDYLKSIVRAGVIATIDTQMIIDEDDFHAVEPGKAIPESAQTPFGEIELRIERTQDLISEEGFSNHNLHTLARDFSGLLFKMFASDAQRAEIASWHDQGVAKYGGFLMSDRGGSSIQQWNSIYIQDGETLELEVDKIWIIEGQQLDYGSVSAASTQKLYPTSILVPPGEFSKLEKTTVGRPFLDGTLQLGNLRGKVTVPKSYMLTSGGLAATSLFLSKVRPRFVRALMAHVLWLARQERIRPSTQQIESARAIEAIARAFYHDLVRRKPSLSMALAIKFAANRLLLDLVTTEAVEDPSIQRDLLAFTRMEGSSYRCLFEIYSKVKAR